MRFDILILVLDQRSDGVVLILDKVRIIQKRRSGSGIRQRQHPGLSANQISLACLGHCQKLRCRRHRHNTPMSAADLQSRFNSVDNSSVEEASSVTREVSSSISGEESKDCSKFSTRPARRELIFKILSLARSFVKELFLAFQYCTTQHTANKY